MKKEDLLEYISDDLSTREIAKKTGRSQGSVRYWLNKYGLHTSLANINRRLSPIWSLDEASFIKLVKTYKSTSDCLLNIGVSRRQYNYEQFYRRCKQMGVVPPKAKNGSHKLKDEDVFVEKSKVRQETLKRRVISHKLKPYRCDICGLPPFWNGKKLILTLDHINGINNDNRLENLRFVCPNCDRQLPTYCAHNRHRGLG